MSDLQLSKVNRLLDQPRLLGLLCAACSVGLSILYLTVAGAPFHYPVVNLAALALGSAMWWVAPRVAGEWNGGAALALAATLLATTLLSSEVNGASRWISAGPLTLQVSLVVLPPIIILYARGTTSLGTAAILAAAVALALQPDRAMAGVLVAGTAGIFISRANRLTVLAVATAMASFGTTLLQPDVVPAAPYVERVLYTAFDVHKLIGVAVVAGCLILLAPTLHAVRANPNYPVLIAFGATWAALIAASALGNYPTPLVGYGGSSVVGYLLSAALLNGPRPLHRRTAARG